MKENNIKDYLSIKPSVLFKVHLIQNKGVQLKLPRGEEIYCPAREISPPPERFPPSLGMIFAPSGHNFPPFLLN